jgi:drug/metabolite transporter (DMT)-like permease
LALLTSAVAGLAGGVGLLLLYLSLARGAMGVAAPLTAVAAGGIPLLVGLLTEGLPGPAQMAGFLLALAAIWVIARGDGGRFRPVDVGLPLLAGVGFGTFLAIMGRLPDEIGFAWPLVAGRVASMALMGSVLLLSRGAGGQGGSGEREQASRGAWSFPWGLAALAGLGDTAGNAFFVLSAQLGRLDVAAVLSALYPAATVLLARLVLDERLTKWQGVGVGLALGAVVLIAL